MPNLNTPDDKVSNENTLEKHLEELYRKIASPESRKAADSLFTISDDDLGRYFKPGETESNQ
ncbi:hypothetical protein LCGC14_3140420 [marine sediment metagenome]|uniref:Uncharacterized protein n=1 Tax=marine sediment metagenome TaxID=412755 RepID=A0A0F8YLE8_9ZZZZ